MSKPIFSMFEGGADMADALAADETDDAIGRWYAERAQRAAELREKYNAASADPKTSLTELAQIRFELECASNTGD